VAAVGSEPESSPIRPLRSADVRFGRYASTLKHLDPPQLFESRPSYRLLGGSRAGRRLGFGLAAYFDKLDVSEALGHEFAAACMAELALTRIRELGARHGCVDDDRCPLTWDDGGYHATIIRVERTPIRWTGYAVCAGYGSWWESARRIRR
jgi:hypothetical protein